MTTVNTTSGKRFESATGETVLDAALRAGVALPYSCRTGRCGTCKCRVRAGTALPLHHEPSLTDAERGAGWILTCVRSAGSDLEIEVEDLGDLHLAVAKTLPCRIHFLQMLSFDVLSVVLRLPPTANFLFHCGQYIDVIGHGGLRRSYSIANAPAIDKHIELHIRKVPGGVMSDYWFGQAKINDLLRLHGPLGTFFLRNVEEMDVVFLATGTGIAPVKAMLEDIANSEVSRAPRSISVYWGGRAPEDLYFDPRIDGVDMKYVPVLSRADASWTGARGYVQQSLLLDPRDWQRTMVYACGSEAMIHDAHRVLTGAGLDERRFLSDAFVCSASAT